MQNDQKPRTLKQILERLNKLIPQYQPYGDIEDEIFQLAKTYIEAILPFRFPSLQKADQDEAIQTALFHLWEQLKRGHISFLNSTYLSNLVMNAVMQLLRKDSGEIPFDGATEVPPDEDEAAKEAYAVLLQESLQSAPRPGKQLEEAEGFKALQVVWFDNQTSARTLYVTLRGFSKAQFQAIAQELDVDASNVLPRGKKARKAAFHSLGGVLGLWRQKQDMCVCFQPPAYRVLWKAGKPNREAGMNEAKIKRILWKLFQLASEYGIEERNFLYQLQFPPHGCIIKEGGYFLTLTIGYIGDPLSWGGVIEISDQETLTVHEIRME